MDDAGARAVEVDILAAPNPPGGGILEMELKHVLLPEFQLGAELDLPGQGDVNMLQEA